MPVRTLKKQKDLIQNYGRSMVEMIAVLAIMGILSLGALSGVNYVKDKNKASQILKEALTQTSEIQATRRIKTNPDDPLDLEIVYPYKKNSEYIKSWSFINSDKKTMVLRAFDVSKGVCEKIVSENSVAIFNCITVGEDETTCEKASPNNCEDGANTLSFIASANISESPTVPTDPCANVKCSGEKVCYSGFCQCPAGTVENEDGECVDCPTPKPVCNKTAAQLSVVDVNGCPIFTQKVCPENACNLLTGDCCDSGKKYNETAGMCCGTPTPIEACDVMMDAKANQCPYYKGCDEDGMTCYTDYDTEGECCVDEHTSESCCYAVHIKNNPGYYNAANATSLLSYKSNDPTQKCQCLHKYAPTQAVCCKEGEIVSEGHCCPTGLEWVEQTKACEVPCRGIGLTGERDATGACICDLGIGNACACPAGQTLINGQCSRMYCSGGPTHYSCVINGSTCGYGCDSTGHGCSHGLCYAEYCPEGTEFTYIPSKGHYIAQYPYRCKSIFEQEGNDLECYTINGKSWICYFEGEKESCMSYFGTSPTPKLDRYTSGLCDPNECNKYTDSAEKVSTYQMLPHPGCYFKADDYYCTHYAWQGSADQKWSCFNNGAVCGRLCENPENCGTCRDINKQSCVSGYSWNSTTKRCEDDNSYCIRTAADKEEHQVWHYCYNKKTEKRCAAHHPNAGGGAWKTGLCSDPGCSKIYYKEKAMTFGYIPAYNVYGCISADGMMQCTTDGDLGYTKAKCAYNGKSCGYKCIGWNGTECDAVYLPECSKEGECPQNGTDMTTNKCLCTGGQVTTVGEKDYCCPNGSIYLGGMCSVSKCPPKENPQNEYVTSGGICVSQEECNGYSMFLSGKMCVEKCPKTQVASEGVCVDACPDAQVVSEGVCVNACPAGQFIFDRICIKSCSANQVLSKGSCVTKCPTGQVIANICNPNNSTSCQNVCVDSCPQGQTPNAENICQ